MMRILVLEDMEPRKLQFKGQHGHHYLKIVETPQECIKELEENEWDWLFLDHDLGGEVFCPSDEKSGYAVACWLEEHPDKKPEYIVVHTENTAGRDKMMAALPESKWIQWAWLFDVEDMEKVFHLMMRLFPAD